MDRLASVLATLEAEGVTHVLGIPDNTSAPLFDALLTHAAIRLVIVTREGEAFAMASGLWLGGARPLVVVQNTGFLESGDALRGTAGRMGAPIPFIVTGRGYAKMVAAGVARSTERTRDLLVRADVDSVALLTEPTLDAWAIPWEACGPERDPALAIAALLSRATELERPCALLLTAELA
jgi:sulfopyruvate decarboxylase TPP-binding subunit